jgi:hypothetical protein
MLDSVLPQAEEVRPRYRIAVLPISNVVRRTHDDGPGTSGCACDDGFICHVICNDLEFGTITTIKDGAIIDGLRIGVTRRQVAPKKERESNRHKATSKLITYSLNSPRGKCSAPCESAPAYIPLRGS